MTCCAGKRTYPRSVTTRSLPADQGDGIQRPTAPARRADRRSQIIHIIPDQEHFIVFEVRPNDLPHFTGLAREAIPHDLRKAEFRNEVVGSPLTLDGRDNILPHVIPVKDLTFEDPFQIQASLLADELSTRHDGFDSYTMRLLLNSLCQKLQQRRNHTRSWGESQ